MVPVLSPATLGGNLDLRLFHETDGEEGICGLALARDGEPPEILRLAVSRDAHTQRVMYDLFAHAGTLYEFPSSVLALGALRPGDIAIDIGAHVGYFTLLFRLAVGPSGRVFAFEPMPDTYRRLLSNVLRNGLANVLPLPLAVADRSGTAVFHVNDRNEGESSLLGANSPDHKTAPVQVTCLDDVFHRDLPTRPRLLKMDAEGVEMSILDGARAWFDRQAPDMVICEINRGVLALGGATEWDIRMFFLKRGYRCALINVPGSDVALDLRGGSYYRYLAPEEEGAPADFPYVHNLMFVRDGSGLYPEPQL